MPYTKRRHCPICFKPDLLSLSNHLSQVHQLKSDARKPYLKAAVFSNAQLPPLMPHPFWTMSQPQQAMHSPPLSVRQRPVVEKVPNRCLETTPYPDFTLNHMFSMLVVGPSQCGKTHFVEKMLTENCIHYPNMKRTRIAWYYNQWQPRYKALQSALGDAIHFTQGIPNLSDDLHEINPKWNNILVFDDLMAQATDSSVLSTLFTQGRHRNASVILLLQNMFPKGKFNTDISRNAQYLVLFRSPSDRKQIDMIAERIFAKDRPNFMSVYGKVTAKPYGYVLIDNQPKTNSENQVVSDVFGECERYPHISTQRIEDMIEPLHPMEPKNQVKRKLNPMKPIAQGNNPSHTLRNKRELVEDVTQSTSSMIKSLKPKKQVKVKKTPTAKKQSVKGTWESFDPTPMKKKRKTATELYDI